MASKKHGQREISTFKTIGEIETQLALLIQDISSITLNHGELFKIGVSGGSMVTSLTNVFQKINTDWSKWRIFFCDERVVPFDDKESTYGTYKQALNGLIPISEEQFVAINANLSAPDAAADYAEKLEKYFPNKKIPDFDLLLLGLGPDGHTCSLFPNHPALKVDDSSVTSITDSPKPPPCRITLTLPTLNNAHLVIFIVTGENKSQAVKRILKENADLPAKFVQPLNGRLIWMLDEAASALIKNQTT